MFPRSVLHSLLTPGRPHGFCLSKAWSPPHGQLGAFAIMLVCHAEIVALPLPQRRSNPIRLTYATIATCPRSPANGYLPDQECPAHIRSLDFKGSVKLLRPPPVMAMLGEIVVHGQDIRRPLGLGHQPPGETLVAVADSYRKTNILIGAKRRFAGLRLRATDSAWSNGDGPEVSGPLISLILAMAGRKGAQPDLTGDGLSTLGDRSYASAGD